MSTATIDKAETEALPVLTFASDLPGFPGQPGYVLVEADETGLAFYLRSVAENGPEFLVIPPAPYFPEYAPRVPKAACETLDLADATDALLLCMVTIPDGNVADATANLFAPIVVNPRTHTAAQVLLDDEGTYPLRQPLRR